MDQQRDYPGCNTAAYFAAHGVHLSPAEARQIVAVFLRLADLGALADSTDARAAHVRPQGARRTRTHGALGVAADSVRASSVLGVLEGPTVYNMGPSDYIGAQK